MTQQHKTVLGILSEAVITIEPEGITFFNRQAKKIIYQCVEDRGDMVANGVMVENYALSFVKNTSVTKESMLSQKKMMSAKVFKMHKRVVDPLEIITKYSLDDFCTMDAQILENSQFMLKIQVEDIEEESFFEIKRQT